MTTHRTMTYELKLQTGEVVAYNGSGPIDAAQRYVNHHPEAVVIATRKAKRVGLFVEADPRLILEPDQWLSEDKRDRQRLALEGGQ